MRYLIILSLFVLIGCGADPDDFQVQESDGCRSDDLECQDALKEETETSSETDKTTDEALEESYETTPSIQVESEVTVKTKIVIGPNGEEISEDDANDCMAGKICRGSTKAEVLDLLGDPDTLDKDDPFEIWEWQDFSGDSIVCSGFSCEIKFRDGLVVDQERIDTTWLDLENF